MPSDTYRWLALYYDHLFHNDIATRRAHRAILTPLLPQVKSACDLCCGTGTLAVKLAAKGITTTAVDLSPDMCRLTREKARAQGVKLKVIRADMRTFTLAAPVDLVTCEYDAINHVPRRSDLRRVVTAVQRALRPRGYFVFDANNRRAFETLWAHTWFLERDPVALVMQGAHRPGSDRASVNVEWFVRHGEMWKRYHERIDEVCWAEGEIRDTLDAAGFDVLQTWDASQFFRDGVTLPGNRTHWLARLR